MMIHSVEFWLMCRSTPIFGSATFTIAMSRTTMKKAQQSSASAFQRRGSGAASAMRVTSGVGERGSAESTWRQLASASVCRSRADTKSMQFRVDRLDTLLAGGRGTPRGTLRGQSEPAREADHRPDRVEAELAVEVLRPVVVHR